MTKNRDDTTDLVCGWLMGLILIALMAYVEMR